MTPEQAAELITSLQDINASIKYGSLYIGVMVLLVNFSIINKRL